MALELTRYRVPARLVDQMTERAYTSRAVASWPRALELLERAGDGVSAGPVAPGNKVPSSRHLSGGWRMGAHPGYLNLFRPGGTGPA